MVVMGADGNFLLYVMFWTILAMMLVLIYSLKQVIMTQKYIRSIDTNIEKLVRKIASDEQRIIDDLENPSKLRKNKTRK